MYHVFRLSLLMSLFLSAEGVGLLILYRPIDATDDCAYSRQLRYDLSFGMGLSDTITLVFRTLNFIDYDCQVEIVADSPEVYLIISIRYPNPIDYNCNRHPNAISVMKKRECFNVCDTIAGRNKDSPYFVTSVVERFRFHFRSNSSINLDMNAHMYQVTVTAARLLPHNLMTCFMKNETACVVNKTTYCFTSGVVCDGIKNCGVADWFDERKSDCNLPVEKLGFASVFAVTAAILFAALIACHLLTKCLPPLANSFFVFNANEDNRLCVDPVFTSPEACLRDIHRVHRMSLVPVSSDSSSTCAYTDVLNKHNVNRINRSILEDPGDQKKLQRSNTMRSMTVKIQERLRAVTLGKHKLSENSGSSSKKSQVHDI